MAARELFPQCFQLHGKDVWRCLDLLRTAMWEGIFQIPQAIPTEWRKTASWYGHDRFDRERKRTRATKSKNLFHYRL